MSERDKAVEGIVDWLESQLAKAKAEGAREEHKQTVEVLRDARESIERLIDGREALNGNRGAYRALARIDAAIRVRDKVTP